jgi:photosystem II stability/assembly factor-like uncharacterized protein
MSRNASGIVLITLLILFITGMCLAQDWEHVYHGHGYPKAFTTDESGQRIVAIYKPGGYWITHDGGENWEPIDSRINPFSFLFQPERIIAVDPAADTLIVNATPLNSRHYGFISYDAGETWSTIDIPGSHTNGWDSAREPGPDGRLYTSAGSNFAFSDDDGTTWEVIDMAAYQTLTRGILLDPNEEQTVYLFGRWANLDPTSGGISVSRDGGETWTLLTEMQALLPPGVSSAVVHDFELLPNGDLLGLVYMYGNQDEDTPFLLLSEDEGETWEWIETTGLPSRRWTTVCVVNEIPGRLFLGESKANPIYGWTGTAGIWQSDDYGLTWQLVPELSNNLMACGDIQRNPYSGDLYASVLGTGLFRSEDHGDTWQPIPGPPVGITGTYNDFLVADESGMMHAGVDGTLWFAQDDATTFTQIVHELATDGSVALTPIKFSDDPFGFHREMIGYLVHEFFNDIRDERMTIVISEDGGATWSESAVNTFSAEQELINVQSFVVDNEIVLMTQQHYANQNLSVSRDLGETWDTIEYLTEHRLHSFRQLNGEIYAIDHMSEDMVYSPTFDGNWNSTGFPGEESFGYFMRFPISIADTILVHNRGQCWALYPDETWEARGEMSGESSTDFISWDIVETQDQRIIVAISSYVDTEMDVSYDDGRTWIPQDLEFNWPYQMSYFSSVCWDPYRERLWVDTGTGLAYLDFAENSVSDPWVLQPASYETVQAYPNPFNASTTIRYSLALPQNVKLDVYDILGRHVASLTDEMRSPGNHTVTFDASTFPSGTYYLRYNAGEITHERKLVLVR